MSADWPTIEEAREFLRTGKGAGIRIAVLDSGIEVGHPALAGLELADDIAIIEEAGRLVQSPGESRDLFGHGTAIAGVLRRVAPEAVLGSFRVLGENLRSRTYLIREGVRLALERGYHILNCSFGCTREDQLLIYKEWIDQAYLLGRHIVVASNNQDFTRREWPGHFPTVITVSFANLQKPEQFFHREGSLVEFAAHGQDVEVPWAGGGRKTVTGSSFAAPVIAGMLARLLENCPSLSTLAAKALLHKLAVPVPRA